MANELDVFRQINNAILDLQGSELQTWERFLKVLARLLRHEELAPFNQVLLDGLDLDAFLERSERTGGGMVGSHQLIWPEDQREVLGLTLLLILKMGDDPNFVLNFSHKYFYYNSKIISGIHNMTRQMIMPFARDYKTYVLSRGEVQARIVMPESNKVFIVHGHDEAALQGLARFLEKLGLEAIILKEQPNQGRTIIEKFEDSAKEVGFAVVLLTPDDLGSAVTGAEQSFRGRQNVIFELGFFAGALGRGRVCLLRKGEVEMPSDLYGIVYTDMDSAGGWKHQLVAELKAAKLDFDANRIW